MKKCLSKNCTGKCTSILYDCGLTRPFSSQIQLMGKVKADRRVKGIYPIFRNAMPFFICQLSQSSTHCLISLAFSYILAELRARTRSTIAKKILVTHRCEKIWFYSHDVIERP